jgi:hypothetical protein
VSDALHERVQRAITGSTPQLGRFWEWPDAAFELLARALFQHQFDHCGPYQHYCRVRGVTPETLPSWEQIPAVPTEVFKSVDLCTFDPATALATFETSGTTLGTRGRLHLRRTDTYRACLGPWLDGLLLPDRTRPRILALAPSWQDDLVSSLSFMLGWAVDRRGATGSRFLWRDGQPDLAGAIAALRRCSDAGVPVLLMGTARAFESLLELGLAGGRGIRLPKGSRLMETGGLKGSDQHLEAGALRRALAGALALPEATIVSEYGMTELASQGYHPVLRASFDDGARGRFVSPDQRRLFAFPPWCRVRAVDPDSLEVLPFGERGLLCFWDLGNVDSVLAVQTADEGIVTPEGVRLFGRAKGASPRGCSLAVDEILGASG